ncbi:MAG: hypothetical protein NZ739_11565 [Verrucomicrobiae bacterium]|nr:hypothetical protein [Verrucomicrobiae bacterium]
MAAEVTSSESNDLTDRRYKFGVRVAVAVLCMCWAGWCAPSIEITELPAYRTFDDLAGKVSGVEPSAHRVAVRT